MDALRRARARNHSALCQYDGLVVERRIVADQLFVGIGAPAVPHRARRRPVFSLFQAGARVFVGSLDRQRRAARDRGRDDLCEFADDDHELSGEIRNWLVFRSVSSRQQSAFS